MVLGSSPSEPTTTQLFKFKNPVNFTKFKNFIAMKSRDFKILNIVKYRCKYRREIQRVQNFKISPPNSVASALNLKFRRLNLPPKFHLFCRFCVSKLGRVAALNNLNLNSVEAQNLPLCALFDRFWRRLPARVIAQDVWAWRMRATTKTATTAITNDFSIEAPVFIALSLEFDEILNFPCVERLNFIYAEL